MFVDLRRRYSDLVLMLDEIAEDREAMDESPTGSRLSGSASSITVIDPKKGDAIARSEYVRRLNKRMQTQLDYLADKLGEGPLEAEMSGTEFAELRERVDAYLLVVSDR